MQVFLEYAPFVIFVHTLGPTPVTLDDMWRMIWEQRCYSIVMVTSLVELGKVRMCICTTASQTRVSMFNSLTDLIKILLIIDCNAFVFYLIQYSLFLLNHIFLIFKNNFILRQIVTKNNLIYSHDGFSLNVRNTGLTKELESTEILK